jgi:hypothetical protein
MSFEGDETGDAIRLKKDDISSAKFSLQGDLKIKSDLIKGDLRFIVPPYTSTTLGGAYILPIDQKDEAAAFRSFIKDSGFVR